MKLKIKKQKLKEINKLQKLTVNLSKNFYKVKDMPGVSYNPSNGKVKVTDKLLAKMRKVGLIEN